MDEKDAFTVLCHCEVLIKAVRRLQESVSRADIADARAALIESANVAEDFIVNHCGED